LRESGIVPFDDALGSAERKLLQALGGDAPAAETLATGTIVAEADQSVAIHLRKLVTAAKERTRVTIDYVTASRASAEERNFDPFGIVHHAGQWYVIGFCHKRQDTRTFRIDRIASLKNLDERFHIPEDFDLETYRRERLYVPSADSIAVGIHLDPLATTRVGSNWPVGDVSHHDDGSSEIVIDCEGFEWVTGWVLGMGKHARIVSPPEAKEAMVERIDRIAESLRV